MNAIEILDLMDEMLDKAWNMPMSNGNVSSTQTA